MPTALDPAAAINSATRFFSPPNQPKNIVVTLIRC